MRYDDYSEQVYMNHLTKKDVELKEEVKRIDDPLLKDIIYNVAQIVARYSDVQDENVLGASNRLEDEVAEIADNMPVIDDDGTDDREDALENEVFELKQRIYELENKL